ncbi:MAG: HlyD family efflux transporter periplasmic adaptor subunit [Clostridia bacterium]|nr:HlyD family efflux transporter periplasmic adaptor subunit [Clostridia bacterium]
MKKIFKNKWFKRAIIALLVIAIAGGVFTFVKSRKSKETEGEEMATAIVTRRSITNTVTGSGTVSAYETYNIVPTVTGEIVFCDVEEGDWVEEDQVLYKFDTEKSDNAISKAENSVENAALSLESAEENVANLTVKAPAQGVVSNLSLTIGDKASGTVCTLTDNTYMIAEIKVSSADVGKISKGDKVSVGLEKYMTTMEGYVDRISSATVAGENGSMVTSVDVIVKNPGSIAEGTYCSATFHTAYGDIDSAEAATLNYPSSAKATAEQSGTVAKINVKNGDWVNEGDVIAVLENSQVTNQLKTAKMNYSDAVSNLADTRKEAEDYVLTAPISGKVMQKNYKKGDTVAGSNSTTLMVVADTTKMKFTINVDELDVAKITVGQEVTIEADAIEGEVFIGKIETVSLLGTSSSGVTYYPVDVVIEQPGDLIPGMNVSAEIIVESAENVIAVPSGAVTYYNGAYYVNVVGEVEGMEDMDSQMGQNRPAMEDMPFGEMPTGDREAMPFREAPTGDSEDMPFGEMPTGDREGRPADGMENRGETGGGMPMGNMGQNNKRGNTEAQVKQNMYQESVRVQVTTGVSDDDYTEIVTGDIKVGMIVEVTGSSSENSGWGMMGGFGGGMPMGGGMGGGRPMGGMR